MDRGADAITAIAVRGYKSILDKQRIEIKPLTILAGANSSGKSSIMQPLLLLKQTLEAPFDPGPLLLDGPNVRFTSAEQLLAKVMRRSGTPGFSVAMEVSGCQLEVNLGTVQAGGIDIVSMTFVDAKGITKTIAPGMSEERIKAALGLGSRGIGAREEGWGLLQVERKRCFLEVVRRLESRPSGGFPQLMGISWVSLVSPGLQELIHLPGLRGNPQRTYRRTGMGPRFPGLFQEYVASVIAHWQSGDERSLEQFRRGLEDLGLTWKVEARSVDDTRVELRVGRLAHPRRGGARDLVNIADVGFGVSQALPVVVALVAAAPGQMVYLEQPEIHLHPRAQRKMAHLLAAAARRGVRVVAETHSGLIVREVQTLVAQGEIKPDDVRLHWFRRGGDGMTEVTTAQLDDDGAYGDWPEEFDEVALASEKDYLDAVERRGERG